MEKHTHRHHHEGPQKPKYAWIITILSFCFLFLCAYLTSLFVPIQF